MCFQVDVFDSCVTQMFLHSCVTQILTEHVHDARFCDLQHVADTSFLLIFMWFHVGISEQSRQTSHFLTLPTLPPTSYSLPSRKV